MKIAFDENCPPQLVKIFQVLAAEVEILRSEIVSARDYPVPKAPSDVPWLQRFAQDGGKVVISGDVAMRGKLVELQALADNNLITIFFHGRWSQMDWYAKTAMVIKWWPVILKTLARARPKAMFEVPCHWSAGELERIKSPKVRKKPGRRKKNVGGQVVVIGADAAPEAR